MDCSVEEFTEFHNYLNSCNDHLKFTLEFNRERISFLDVQVYRRANTIQTDLFRKPTDRNSLLRGDSFHPRPLVKSLPVSQFHRVRRICSEDDTYKKQATDSPWATRDICIPKGGKGCLSFLRSSMCVDNILV